MIRFTQSNIFDSGCQALVNPVNCVGVMGKGLALQFRHRFPANFEAYRDACARREVRPGRCFVFDTGAGRPRFVVNFPTKRHWRDRSRIEDIAGGLDDLAAILRRRAILSVTIPPLGCGLGGLPWPTVRSLLVDRLAPCERVSVVIYEPGDRERRRACGEAKRGRAGGSPPPATEDDGMRTYRRDEACGFRFTRQAWGEFSNFAPLAAPIAAGPWSFPTSEHLYQAAKFGAAPEVQRRIANAPTAREAAGIGRGTGIGMDPCWNAQRVNAMRWVLRMKREANAAAIDAALARTGERAIVEVSARDPWWGAKPAGDSYRGENVLGRLWMELRQQLRADDPAARAAAWTGRIRVGRLADAPRA